jgi:hypothetical protein
MNPRIQKAYDDIDRTKAKIAELQALLPELERKRTDLENTEIVRLVRQANIAPGDIADFVESIKTNQQADLPRQNSRVQDGRQPSAPPSTLNQEEVSDNDNEA